MPIVITAYVIFMWDVSKSEFVYYFSAIEIQIKEDYVSY